MAQVQQTEVIVVVDSDDDDVVRVDEVPVSPMVPPRLVSPPAQAAAQSAAPSAKAVLKAPTPTQSPGRAATGHNHSRSHHDHDQGRAQRQGGAVVDQRHTSAEQHEGSAAAHKKAQAPHTGKPKKLRRPAEEGSPANRAPHTQPKPSGSTSSSDETPLAKLASTTTSRPTGTQSAQSAQSPQSPRATALRSDPNDDLLDANSPGTVQIEPVPETEPAAEAEPSEQRKSKTAAATKRPAHAEASADMHRTEEPTAVGNNANTDSATAGAGLPAASAASAALKAPPAPRTPPKAKAAAAGNGRPGTWRAERQTENTDEKAAAAAATAADSSHTNAMKRGLLAGQREERAADPASKSPSVTAKPRPLSQEAGSAAAPQEASRRPKQAGAEDHAVAATAAALPVSPAYELNLNAWVRSAWVKTQGPPFRTNLSSRAVSELRALPENHPSRIGKLGRRALSFILLITCRRCSNHTHLHFPLFPFSQN
jgi:hypothetical protein